MGPAAEGSGDLIQDQNRALKTSKDGIFPYDSDHRRDQRRQRLDLWRPTAREAGEAPRCRDARGAVATGRKDPLPRNRAQRQGHQGPGDPLAFCRRHRGAHRERLVSHRRHGGRAVLGPHDVGHRRRNRVQSAGARRRRDAQRTAAPDSGRKGITLASRPLADDDFASGNGGRDRSSPARFLHEAGERRRPGRAQRQPHSRSAGTSPRRRAPLGWGLKKAVIRVSCLVFRDPKTKP